MEEGSHEALMGAEGSMYRSMWERQAAEELQQKLASTSQDMGATMSDDEAVSSASQPVLARA